MSAAARGSTGRLVLVGTLIVAGVLVWLLAGGSGGGAGVTAASAPSAAGSPTSAAGSPTASAGAARRTSGANRTSTTARAGSPQPPTGADLRSKAQFVLATLDATGRPPSGYQGGRQFLNDGRGGTTPLPRRTPAGRAVEYHEYDVNPYTPGVNRGPQRLVVGDDGSAYATGDHYITWQRLR